MNKLRLMLLEDNPLDAELILASLAEGGIDCAAVRALARADFLAALEAGPFDLILADFSLPSFDGISALKIAQEICPQVPFLFVSGAIGEERAIETLKSGATDYVLKQHLERLVPSVRRALREAEERAERRRAERALRESEERFRLLIDGVRDYAIFLLDQDGRVVSWNEGAERILGHGAEEVVGQHIERFYGAEEVCAGAPRRRLELASIEGQAEEETWLVRKDGSRFWASGVATALRDEAGRPRGFAIILRDLTDRKRLEEALRQRAEELAESDRRKDDFLAMLSHELRNPLAPVRNALQIMRLRGLDDPTLRQARDIIDRQVEHMTRLVDDLLDVSRITSGKILLRKERVELAAIINLAVETGRPLIEKRHHRLSVMLAEEPLWLEADSVRLSQVLANLLNNAAKYTDPGGRIWLAARREAGVAVVSVRDTGIGIAPEMKAHIFDLFMQADQSLDRSLGGLGIGLTLVRRLVEMHGGTIHVDSAGPGRGSEFTVRLPLEKGRETRIQEDKETRRQGEKERSDRDAVSLSLGLPVSISPLRILVVDDNKDGAESLAMMLELWGHEVGVAYEGATALEMAQARPPDVVLLDIGLPGMDGLEVAARLRRQPGMERVLLVALTGYGHPEDRRRSLAAGFDAHLVKPVDPTKLKPLLAQGKRVESMPSGEGTAPS